MAKRIPKWVVGIPNKKKIDSADNVNVAFSYGETNSEIVGIPDKKRKRFGADTIGLMVGDATGNGT